jgi:hypothetical protein
MMLAMLNASLDRANKLTIDDLVNKVADRRLDAALVAEAPAAHTLGHVPVFAERPINTPLIWRQGEISPPVLALRTLIAALPKGESRA